MELDNLCSVCHWNGSLFPVVLQCVWIYPDDIFFFVGTMLTDQEKAPKERWKEMIQKGLFILVIVCVIALWWFIRNAILYHGDFLGRETSSACAELYARAKYKPSNSKTFRKKATPCYV